MPSAPTLLLDLAGVARLAEVQRPVASMWRTRFASASDPFPPVVDEQGGRALFDAMEVAQWLARTKHGNNRDATADAAASASPYDFDFTDASHVDIVDALLALRSASGGPVGGLGAGELQRQAAAVDPDDSLLVKEISSVRAAWAEWADLLADAAYSPTYASRILERRHAATRASAGSSGPLAATAERLLVGLAGELVLDKRAELVVNAGIAPSLAAELLSRLGDEAELVVPPGLEGRRVRRRCICEGLALPAASSMSDAPRLFIERLPSTTARSASEILRAIDELVLGMRDHDRAIVVAPAAVLIEPVAHSDDLVRADVLRTGRVRVIAKLPAGLLAASTREALALWVLGREAGDVALADRVTAVADLTDVQLTDAARADLTSDVSAAMGGARDKRDHAFRFTRLVRTTSLIASRGALVSGGVVRAVITQSSTDLPALVDHALLALGPDAPEFSITAAPGPTLPAVRVEQLVADRHVRVQVGTRIATDEFSASGLVVVGPADLDDPARIGPRRVDPLAFAARHPSARLTEAGDVIFRTSPTANAWVDPDGSKVVEQPARVLRIDRSDPGGLVPELVVADINGSAGGPGRWRRWRLRRVVPQNTRPLHDAMADVARRREALVRRIAALDSYAEVLASAVVSGAVTLTDHAAVAVSDK